MRLLLPEAVPKYHPESLIMPAVDRKPLSPRMRDLVRFIDRHMRERGYPPSMSDAGRDLKVSRTTALRLARAAAERGAIEFDPQTARSWRVVDLAAALEVVPPKKRR